MGTNSIITNSSNAPLGASYIVVSSNTVLPDERVATGTSNQITITDNGPGSTIVFSLPQNIHTSATPTFAGLSIIGGTSTFQPTEAVTNVMYSFVHAPPITNLVTNPSFEVDTAGWSALGAGSITRSNTIAKQGDWSLRVDTPATTNTGASTVVNVASSSKYGYSCFIATASGTASSINISATGDVSGVGYTAFTTATIVTTTWQRIYGFSQTTTDTTLTLKIYQTGSSAQTFYIDCVQCELTTDGTISGGPPPTAYSDLDFGHPTAYADGSMGGGHAWTGTPHASTSTRASGVHILGPTTAGGSTGLVVKRDGTIGGSHIVFSPEHRYAPLGAFVDSSGNTGLMKSEFFYIYGDISSNSLLADSSLARITNDSGKALALQCGGNDTVLTLAAPSVTNATILGIFAPSDLSNFSGAYFSFSDKANRNMYQWTRDSCIYGAINLGYAKMSLFYGAGAYTETKTATTGTGAWSGTAVTGTGTAWNTVGANQVFPGDVFKFSGSSTIGIVQSVTSDTALVSTASGTVSAGATFSRSSQQYGTHKVFFEGPYGDHCGIGKSDATTALWLTSADTFKVLPTTFTANTALSGSPTFSITSGSTSGTFSGAVVTADFTVGDWIHPVGHIPLRCVARASNTTGIFVDPVNRTGATSTLTNVAFYVQKGNAQTAPSSDSSGEGLVQVKWQSVASAGPSASTTETSLLGSAMILRSRVLDTTRTFRITLRGTLVGANAAKTLTLRFKLNSTTVITSRAEVYTDTNTNIWNITASITANNSQTAQQCFLSFVGQPDVLASIPETMVLYGAGTENTERDMTVDVTAQWGVGASTMTTLTGYGEIV